MKILIATGIFPPELGGPALYAYRFSEELVEQGHEVFAVCYSDRDKYSFDELLPYGVKRIKRKNIFFNYFNYFKAVFFVVRHVDVVYAFDYFSAGLPSLLAVKVCRKKMAVRNGGDLLWERYLEKYGKGMTMKDFYEKGLHKKFIFKFFVSKIVLKLTDIVVFTTRLQSDIFSKYYKIDKRKSYIIPNAFPSQIEKRFKNWDFSKTNEIIWAGRMVEKNNLKRLVSTFCDIGQKKYRLVLIGEGRLKEEIKKTIEQKKCKNISVEDKMSNDKLLERLSRAHAAVFPAYTDISPVLLLECLATRTPFLATRENGFDWLKNKILDFDPLNEKSIKDAFLKIMDDDFYDSYLQKISEIKYDYTFKRAVKETTDLLKNGTKPR